MVSVIYKEVFDFEELAFKRLESKFFEGLTIREFRRVCGVLFSLNKNQSKELLKRFNRRYNVKIARGWVYVR